MSQQLVVGTCAQCGHELWMYYEPYCPLCEPPQPNEGPSDVSLMWTEMMGKTDQRAQKKDHFCLERVLNYMEAKGQPGIHDAMPEQLGGRYCLWHIMLDAQKRAGTYDGFHNDRVCRFTFDPQYYPKNPVVQAYLAAVLEVIGEPTQRFWVSW